MSMATKTPSMTMPTTDSWEAKYSVRKRNVPSLVFADDGANASTKQADERANPYPEDA